MFFYHFEGRPWTAFFAVVVLVVIWSFRLGAYDAVSGLVYGGWQGGTTASQTEEERMFIQQAMDVEFPAPIDYAPIREVCTRNPDNFRPGLLFTCEGQHGGIGMVRNQILKCVRHAINAGAALVVPSMSLRNADDITDIETTTEVPLDYLLDRRAFVARLTEGCPGMRVYERPEDFPGWDRHVDVDLVADQFEPDHPPEGLRYPREWRRFFDEWLARDAGAPGAPRADAPVHVRLGQAFLEFPVHDDGRAFVREFGKILSFRNETRALAARVLWALRNTRVGGGGSGSGDFPLAHLDPSVAVTPGAYYGAHLRLEADAVWAWPPEEWRFSRTEEQFEQQLRNIARTGLRVVYVASGDQAVVDRFAAALRASPLVERAGDVAVVTKYDLLRGADRRALDALTFDQQALVDFLVMFRASAFMGVAHSSFPWNVALRRHELSRYEAYANEGSDLLRDEYSIIMGMAADYPHVDPFITGIWP